MLKSIRLQNFFGFQDCTINLEKGANVLVGINGSGKSNFFKAVRLLISTVTGSFDHYFLREWGGFESVTNYSNSDYNPIVLKFVFDGMSIPSVENFNIRADIYYELSTYKVAGINNYSVSEKIYQEREGNTIMYFNREGSNSTIIEKSDNAGSGTINRQMNIDAKVPYLNRIFDTLRFPELTLLRNAINKIHVYDQFNTNNYSPIRRSITANFEDRLSINGENLTSLLQTLKANDKATLKRIINAFCSVNEQYVNIDYGIIGGGNIELQIEEKGFRKNIPAANISDGTLKFLCLMAILYNPNRGSVVCIDEPELGLHPDMINTLHEAIEFASETSQIIISTHSAHLLNYFDIEQVRVFEKDENNATIVNQFSKEQFAGWQQKFELGKAWREGDIGGKRW